MPYKALKGLIEPLSAISSWMVAPWDSPGTPLGIPWLFFPGNPLAILSWDLWEPLGASGSPWKPLGTPGNSKEFPGRSWDLWESPGNPLAILPWELLGTPGSP